MGDNKLTEKENKRELYYPRFPDRWERRPLYSMAKWVNGIAFRNIQFSTTGLPVIKIAEIKNGITGQTKFTEQIFDESVRVKPGDLLFSWSGQPETSINAFWWKGPVGWLNQHIFRVTPAENIEPGFFYYLLRYLRPNFIRIARNKQTTGLGHVTKRDLQTIEAAFPELPEQRAIAHILGTLDDKIELNRQMNRTLEAMAQALFKSWFIDFDPVVVNALRAGNPVPEKFAERSAHYRDNPDALRLPEDTLRQFPDRFRDSELGPIPEGWEVKPIGDLVKCVGGATPSTKKPEFWEGGTNPFLTPKDMASLDSRVVLDTERHITDAGVEKISSKKLPIGTVLLSSRAPIGYLAINEVPVSVNQGIIAMICDGPLPNHYVFFWTKNNMDVIKGKAGGTTFAEISKKNFRPIPALQPSEKVLDAFANMAGLLYQQLVENTVSCVTLAKLRDTLLPKLISGELRVPDAEKLLEDAL